MQNLMSEYYETVSDKGAIEWIVDRCSPVPPSVLSTIVPAGFDAYIRIFPPARPRVGGMSVTWNDVALQHKRIPHRAMQWFSISPESDGNELYPPREGELPDTVARILFECLTQFTNPDEVCFAGFWAGYGNLDGWPDAIRFETSPGVQDHFVLSTDFASAAEHWFETLRLRHGRETCGLTPNILWPAGRHWYLAVPYNRQSCYLGCAFEIAQAVLNLSDLEVCEAQITDDIWVDAIND